MKKIVLPKYSMPVTRPGGCCGTAASKNFVFGNQDIPTGCCGDVDPVIYEDIYNSRGGTQESTPYIFSNLECPVTLCFSASPSNPDAAQKILTLFTFIGGNITSTSMPLNNTGVCKTFNNGDSFYFFAQSDECQTYTVNAVNQTCGTNLGTILLISVFFDPPCTICPPWDLGNRHSFTQTLSHSWQYLGGNSQISVRLNCDNNVLNFTTLVTAYVNTTPVIGGTSFTLMEFGSSFGDIDVPMNPGEYLIIEMQVFDADCADVFINFFNVSCQEPISSGQIDKFQVNKGAC